MYTLSCMYTSVGVTLHMHMHRKGLVERVHAWVRGEGGGGVKRAWYVVSKWCWCLCVAWGAVFDSDFADFHGRNFAYFYGCNATSRRSCMAYGIPSPDCVA